MASKALSGKKNHASVGSVQILLFFALAAVFFMIFQMYLIPRGISGFVVPLFKPSSEQLEKFGFADFGNQTTASVKEQKGELNWSGKTITPELINKEYIFDFSFSTRNLKENGYAKASNEFYVKAPALGETPIILEPWIGFIGLSLVIGVALAFLITMFMPSGLGLMAALFDDQIDHVKIKIRLQTGFTDEVVEILTMPDSRLREFDRDEVESAFRTVWERTLSELELSSKKLIDFEDIFDDNTDVVFFRNEAIYNRIKEFFSDFVVTEITDTKQAQLWRGNRLLILKGFRLYMSHHFTEKYSNNVTGLAYAGAAVLIVAVGIRGLKFIPANKPSFILFAIFLEFALLGLMAITLIYTEEEERMDKMLKKMEDANRSQLETLRGQQKDIHQLSTALVGQTSEIIKQRVESAISDYMTSGDQIQQQIARSIADKIVFDIKGDTGGARGARRR